MKPKAITPEQLKEVFKSGTDDEIWHTLASLNADNVEPFREIINTYRDKIDRVVSISKELVIKWIPDQKKLLEDLNIRVGDKVSLRRKSIHYTIDEFKEDDIFGLSIKFTGLDGKSFYTTPEIAISELKIKKV